MKVTRCCIRSGQQFGWPSIRTYATETIINHEQNYYTILGVTPNCPKTRIKVAYYKLTKKYHPDVNKTEEAKVKFQEISEAYDVLSNPITRNEYDKARASFAPSYRSKVRHGQEKYKPKGVIYPTGRSSTYNFDEWHMQHYQSTMEMNWKQKNVRENRMSINELNSYNKERDKFKGVDSHKPGLTALVYAVGLLGLGCVYYFLSSKLKTFEKRIGARKDS